VQPRGCPQAVPRLLSFGIRLTDQRLQIARILLSAPQHLSAEQVAEALRREDARVSKATVYNVVIWLRRRQSST
jgi:Fur family iron response transcriptional regulator